MSSFLCSSNPRQKTIVQAIAVTNVGSVPAEAWQRIEATFIRERDCKVVKITQPRSS